MIAKSCEKKRARRNLKMVKEHEETRIGEKYFTSQRKNEECDKISDEGKKKVWTGGRGRKERGIHRREEE